MTDLATEGSAAAADPAPAPAGGLDAGTYEVLRARLAEQAGRLAERAEELNTRRVAAFGGTGLRLAGTARIRTAHNCVPRDLVPVGGRLLFGFNVFMGLKPETGVGDVFSLHAFVPGEGEGAFRFDAVDPADPPGLLDDPRFARDFGELYRYYRDTRLLQLRRVEEKLLAVFQTGPNVTDARVLRWAVAPDGGVSYLDNRGERDHVFPPRHDFEWTPATREDHVQGRHPHISVRGELFVETVGGDLTVKVENNTEVGEGVYSEPVAEPLQSLADAEIAHARVGPLILLRVLPYNETQTRYLVFNTRTKDVVRLDGIGQACLRLPDDQGIIFPGGYHLATGAVKTFDAVPPDLEVEKVVRSPNGEDVLYVFHARQEGRGLLLPYNVIRKEVAAPIPCHGYSLFDDGTLVVLRAETDEPARVHPLQVWRTPFVSDTHAAAQPVGTGPLERVGNAELVRAVSDSLSVARMVHDMTPSTAVFEALIAACRRMADRYHWLGEPGLGGLAGPLAEVRATAEQVLDEFENVQALTAQAAEAVEEAAERVAALVRRSRGDDPRTAEGWTERLTELRRAQGHLVTVRDLRHADTARVDELAERLAEELAAAGRRAVDFLQGEDAFTPYLAEVERLAADAEAVTAVAEAEPVAGRIAARTEGLEVVTEVVGSLDIADARVRTRILEHVGEVMGGLNRARAALAARRTALLSAEGRAAFAAEFALLGQAVSGALAAADTPERCDDQLGRLLLRLEDLESRFAEFDDFLAELAAKREDVYEAFSARRQALLDERARRADRLVESAGRVLAGVARRVAALDSLEEVNTYFAADPMVARVRATAEELRALGDQVRAEELAGRLKAARQEAGRALRDRVDLYDGDTVRLGRHRFAVNTQPLDLTLVPADGTMALAVTGTDFRAPVTDPDFLATRALWERTLASESPAVYRAEYLAVAVLTAAESGAGPASLADLERAAAEDGTPPPGLLRLVRAAAEERYDEGYERGVHDHDAALILAALLRLYAGADLLRHPAPARAAAQLFWAYGAAEADRAAWTTRAVSLARARAAFGTARPPAADALCAELAEAAAAFLAEAGLPADGAAGAGEYLAEELAAARGGFVTGAGARTLLDRFGRALEGTAAASRADFERDLAALGGDLAARHQLVTAWLESYASTLTGTGADTGSAAESAAGAGADLGEAAAVELCGTRLERRDSEAPLSAVVDGLLGAHPRVSGRRMVLRLDEVLARVRRFAAEDAPAFRDYLRRRNALVARERARLRLEEYRPRVPAGFVRNRLLDEVYLPLIGDNLAKQIGAAGDSKRTDQSGLLLLISPPGYGKTTLMEYVASRLGLVFVKVNGPALGHGVTSLDPADAPNAAARQEVEKISFALEMGGNALLYLDDIQHTNPELLQRFISLCDGQRRMEGVWEGRTRTYDLRGKRFAVCMAGNPYTERGGRFRLPDMLANRADVYNLGDVLSGRDALFGLSYIENALTSNPVLAPLSTRERADVELLARMAQGDESARPDRLSHPYSAVELEQMLSVLRKLVRVREVVLAVNRAYIASAAQAEESRTEPAFRLQGSYRNMNRLAEKIVPVMNDAELEAVLDDHYQGEAQTLTSDAEANLLKLAELRGTLDAARAARWAEVKAAFRRARALGGDGDDPVSRAVGAVGLLADRVGAVESAIDRAAGRLGG
ncbi:hypothetical protein HNR12_002939 [Streptomonospora nanhaiensis]|uniref:AAA+ ATPase domain-containing protein n=1 Tax=Streptomonospora nanhaiensis TaxID=1323731 RepID=A0A853BQH7_9ACTN|nr:hypothetical protein [Streptomonospora nanhaiensis]